jgi:CHAD domain-containing protein
MARMDAVPSLHPFAQLEPREEDELERFVEGQRRQLVEREPGVRLGGDPEELHKQRVATRRLRSVLRSARPLLADPERSEQLRDELRWLGGVLGEVRDRDVLTGYLLEEVTRLEEGAAFGGVLELLDAEREEARRALLRALDSGRYKKLLGELERAPQLRAGETLEAAAAREYRRLRKAVDALDDDPSDDDLHRVRIRAKRTRYAAEAAGARKQIIERAKALQDVLGEHQDAVVAEERIRSLLAEVRGTGRTALAAGRLIERQRARQAGARASWRKAWKRLARACDSAWR